VVEPIPARLNPIPCSRSGDEIAKALTSSTLALWIAILLALVHAALAVTANIEKSPTFDEPTHLTAGYSYWLRHDFRLDPENGNLPARLAALPLLLHRPNFPPSESQPWKQVSVGQTSQRFFYRVGNDPDEILLLGRIAMSVISAALCLFIFFCSRHFFGVIGGLISETIAVFDPNLLAHGALITSDVAAAFFFSAAAWTTWDLLQHVTARTLLLAILSAAALALTKMSAPIFCFMAAGLAAIRILSDAPIEIRVARFQRTFVARNEKTFLVLALAVVGAAAVVLSIWASFCFRFSALQEGGQPREILNARWEYLLSERSLTKNAVAFARQYHLLPEAYLFGLGYVEQTSVGRPAFLDGELSNFGFASFFPRAFIYKTPLSIFCLAALALLAATQRWRCRSVGSNQEWWRIARSDLAKLAPLWIVILVYVFFALKSPLNIGHRHLLPIYPAIFIVCGACAPFFRVAPIRITSALISVLVGWLVIDSFEVRPDYLAYFNQAAGGPDNGYKHLIDSSTDWGQDLPALKMWLDENSRKDANEGVYLAYFGTADQAWYGVRAIALPESARDGTLLPLRPGLYCISATTLQQVYASEQGKWAPEYEAAYQRTRRYVGYYLKIGHAPMDDIANRLRRRQIETFQRLRFARLCAYLRHREPVANVGCSILVFYLTRSDLHHALEGPPVELVSRL
jgi:hypothetical protein